MGCKNHESYYRLKGRVALLHMENGCSLTRMGAVRKAMRVHGLLMQGFLVVQGQHLHKLCPAENGREGRQLAPQSLLESCLVELTVLPCTTNAQLFELLRSGSVSCTQFHCMSTCMSMYTSAHALDCPEWLWMIQSTHHNDCIAQHKRGVLE